MNPDDLIVAARDDESFLVGVFNGFERIQNHDSVGDWIVEFLKKAPEFAPLFELPGAKPLIAAYRSVLQTTSLITRPLLHLLTLRLNVYMANIDELLSHPMASNTLKEASVGIERFRNLLRKYAPVNRGSSHAALAESIRNHRIHHYADEWNNTALRAVLKWISLNPDSDSPKDTSELMEFILSQLELETECSGHIPEPRHGWWAVETLAKHAQETWLKSKRRRLSRVLKHLLELPEYTPRQDVSDRSIAPELNTSELEGLWVGINIARIMESCVYPLLDPSVLEQLKKRFDEQQWASQKLAAGSSFKLRSIRLLFTYERFRLHALFSAHDMCRKKKVDLAMCRFGASYWAAPVVAQISVCSNIAKRYLERPKTWTKHTLTAAMVCGMPGQGKSEMLSQMAAIFSELSEQHGLKMDVRSFSVGKEINAAEDVGRALDAYRKDSAAADKCSFLMMFDEIDKASGFNIYTPFLSGLEEKFEAGKRPVTFWVFAQSTHPSLSDYKAYAETLQENSMRDFLTRIQWGGIELPELRFSPEQRVMTALGCACKKQPGLLRIKGRWAAYFAGAYHMSHARILIKEVELSTEVAPKGVVDVPSDRMLSARWLSNLPGGGMNEIRLNY